MAKATITAGSEFDVLTQDELRTVLEETLSGYLRGPYRVRIEAGDVTDGSGNLGPLPIFTVRRGFRFLLNRLEFAPAGFSYASPYTATAGAVEILRGNDVLDGYPFGPAAGSLPAHVEYNRAQALDFVDGEQVQVQIVGGPISTPFLFLGHGEVSPIEPDL